ncbi:MAG: hypothetical protein QMD44_12130 [Thermodesulfovibrionales bacterium]|nr:hypothetical protein [Thermodesulfovibrionales bacterium]
MEEGKYKIAVNGRWTLEDLYVFPRAYEQVYFLMYSLLPQEEDLAVERIQHAYAAFPWRGGYSAVNFYNQLKYVLPKNQRPAIVSIQYASPGWIELALLVGVAVSVERLIKSIANSIDRANQVYHNIHTGLQQRKLLRIETKRKELQLKKEEREYVDDSLKQMAQLLGFKNLAEINARTGNPYITLKILLSFYRRLRTLADYQKRGKTNL